jgi:hypothetical protein
MDTPQDFQFLIESVAQKYNPYQEGEYLVIQTLPRQMRLRAIFRGFDYQKISTKCELENFSHDYSSFGLRIFHQGKLYRVLSDGTPGEVSKQQNWQIHPTYLEAYYDQNSDGEIILCNCSYPYFNCILDDNSDDEPQPITCLIEDFGEIINNCPNCGVQLVEEDDDDEEEDYVPPACEGCCNYHGELYGENLLVCAIHPYGCEDDACPDYTHPNH